MTVSWTGPKHITGLTVEQPYRDKKTVYTHIHSYTQIVLHPGSNPVSRPHALSPIVATHSNPCLLPRPHLQPFYSPDKRGHHFYTWCRCSEPTEKECHWLLSTVIIELVAGSLGSLMMRLCLSLSAISPEWTGNTWCMSDRVQADVATAVCRRPATYTERNGTSLQDCLYHAHEHSHGGFVLFYESTIWASWVVERFSGILGYLAFIDGTDFKLERGKESGDNTKSKVLSLRRTSSCSGQLKHWVEIMIPCHYNEWDYSIDAYRVQIGVHFRLCNFPTESNQAQEKTKRAWPKTGSHSAFYVQTPPKMFVRTLWDQIRYPLQCNAKGSGVNLIHWIVFLCLITDECSGKKSSD